MSPRSSRSLAGSPLLIGAVTTLVVIVAVFLSYNANNGLPFVPTYNIKIQLPDADSLQVGNDVRIGGTRVGIGQPETARAESAYRSGERDHQAEAREAPAGAAGRHHGAGARPLGARREVPRADPGSLDAQAPARLDAAAVRGDPAAGADRSAAQHVQRADANGRADQPRRLRRRVRRPWRQPQRHHLQPRAHADQPRAARPHAGRTRARTSPGSSRRSSGPPSDVAPVAEQNAQVFVDLDTTFKALAAVAPSIGTGHRRRLRRRSPRPRTRSPSSVRSSRKLHPFLLAARARAPWRCATPRRASGGRCRPAPRTSRAATARQPRAGCHARRAWPRSRRTRRCRRALQDLTTHRHRRQSRSSADLGSMQSLCNYPTLLLRNLVRRAVGGRRASAPGCARCRSSRRRSSTPSPRANRPTRPPRSPGRNNEGGPASAPANGGNLGTDASAAAIESADNHLHATPYPYVGAPGPARRVRGRQRGLRRRARRSIGHAASVADQPRFRDRADGRDEATSPRAAVAARRRAGRRCACAVAG